MLPLYVAYEQGCSQSQTENHWSSNSPHSPWILLHTLARSANLPTGLYIFTFRNFFFFKLKPNYRRIYWTDLHDFFLPNERYLRDFIIYPDLFSRFLKGHWHDNQFWAKYAKWFSFNTLAFRNRFEYRNSDLQVLNGNIFATFCANLTTIGPLTPEITAGVPVAFGTRWQKSAYLTKYLSKYWTELHQHFTFSISKHVYGDYKTDISFMVAYGNQLILGLFLLAFQKKMQYHFVSAHINSCTNSSTSYKNMVKIDPVVFWVKPGENVKIFKQLAKKLGKNLHIAPNISEYTGPIFTKYS